MTFQRCGVIDPVSFAEYTAHGGYKGLDRAFSIGPEATVAEIAASGLRGRGGAEFPTGIKWKTVADCPAGKKYVVVNADEGDSGTFADRMIMEGDPLSLIEGMTICAFAIGADKGYVYLRAEYPIAAEIFGEALIAARAAGASGQECPRLQPLLRHRAAHGRRRLCLRRGDLAARKPGRQARHRRAKPPLPAHVGLFGKPTVVNNVLSMATAPMILADGGAAYHALRHGPLARHHSVADRRQRQIRRTVQRLPFGLKLGEIVNDIGGGTLFGTAACARCRSAVRWRPMCRCRCSTRRFDYEAFSQGRQR